MEGFIKYDPQLMLNCKWRNCHASYPSQDALYDHLSQEHVGRKASRNLCLYCHWDSCETEFYKRDHITSHLRVHIELKSFQCTVCTKSFKRKQDLNKHSKRIHKEGPAQELIFKNETSFSISSCYFSQHQ
ncbi:hypothetical protein DSO57_1017554 [Entomophthora muscae]|uniref:Uncharacterized protein n=2 Tax=Entomophthora muscae TaxID=34485 RepID=A0ACC2SLR7_9FUNG|nr:hypothetical protein DSO57_1003625 [Entomophthora muscae]KAJ9065623.1 hypothetical protein DSO57_1017554 [Entomophthora muscae]